MKVYLGVLMMVFGIILVIASLTETGIESQGRMTRGTVWTIGGVIVAVC